jgi:hypothetical protein
MISSRPNKRLLACLLLPLLAGCSEYNNDYYYIAQPNPGLQQTTPITTQPIGATSQPATLQPVVQAAIVGVRNADKDKNIPYSVEVQIGVNNPTANVLYLNPNSLSLSGAGLWFNAPIVVPPGTVTLAPRATAMLTAYFPFPAGRDVDHFNVSTLTLTWHATSGDEQLAQSIAFMRVEPADDGSAYAGDGYYYTPYDYPGAWYGGLGFYGLGPYYYRHHPQYWRRPVAGGNYNAGARPIFTPNSAAGLHPAGPTQSIVNTPPPNVSHVMSAPGNLPLNHR